MAHDARETREEGRAPKPTATFRAARGCRARRETRTWQPLSQAPLASITPRALDAAIKQGGMPFLIEALLT